MSKPSFRVTLLLLLVLSITAWNVLRLWTALAWRDVLTEFSGAEMSTVIIVSGAGWTLAGIFSAWATVSQKPWAWKFLLLISAAYSAWYWVARLVWQAPRANWQFVALVNLILLVCVFFITQSLSREAYERATENPKTE